MNKKYMAGIEKLSRNGEYEKIAGMSLENPELKYSLTRELLVKVMEVYEKLIPESNKKSLSGKSTELTEVVKNMNRGVF